MLRNLLTLGNKIGKFAQNSFTPGMIKAGKRTGKFAGKAIEKGFKAGATVGNEGFKFLNKAHEGKFMTKGAEKLGKITGQSISEVNLLGTAGKGLFEMAQGFEAPELNKLRTGITGKNYTGTKYLGLIKKTDNNLLGYKATGLGQLALGTVALGAGVVDAGKEFNASRMGRNVGTVKNAPINSYAEDRQGTMGNAYANNAGATGDLVFALHNQRHNGFL